MAELAQKRMRVKIPQLTEALYGRFTSHHAFLTRMHLDLIDQHTAAIEQLTDRIEVVMEPFRGFRDLICTIPGIGGYTADIVVAETGADMTRFPTAQHLASWAGTTPGNNESAGKVKSRRTRPGNRYLQGALGTAAMSISHTHGTYLAAKYRRIAPAGARSKPTLLFNARCSSRSGTSPQPTPPTTTPAATTSPASTPTKPETTPSANSNPWATTSPSTRRPDRATHPANSPHGNLLVSVIVFMVATWRRHRCTSMGYCTAAIVGVRADYHVNVAQPRERCVGSDENTAERRSWRPPGDASNMFPHALRCQ